MYSTSDPPVVLPAKIEQLECVLKKSDAASTNEVYTCNLSQSGLAALARVVAKPPPGLWGPKAKAKASSKPKAAPKWKSSKFLKTIKTHLKTAPAKKEVVLHVPENYGPGSDGILPV